MENTERGRKQEEIGLTAAIIKGKLETSPKVLAENYADFFTEKLKTIKEEMMDNNVVAEGVIKTLVPRVDNNLIIKEVKIRDVKKIIQQLKPSKLRGSDELNMFIMRKIPFFLPSA